MRKAFLSAALIAASLALAAPSRAVIFNGGFEAGDFSNWTQGGNTNFTGVTCPGGVDPRVNQGNCAAFLGPVDSTGSLLQGVSTVAGNSYTVAFSLLADGGAPSNFSAFFGGNILLLLNNLPASATYTNYSFDVLAAGPSTNLSFTFQNDDGFLYLDSVSVVDNGRPTAGIPEPTTWAMLLTGFGAAGLAVRRRRGRRLDGASA